MIRLVLYCKKSILELIIIYCLVDIIEKSNKK